MHRPGTLHHVELYVASLEEELRFWEPFLLRLGYKAFRRWELGVSYLLAETYLVFVQVEEAYVAAGYHRKRPGLDHLAFMRRPESTSMR